jgi:hypothetical protein
VFNLIHQGTSPIFQAQNGLPRVDLVVEIGEKSRYFRHNWPDRFTGTVQGEGHETNYNWCFAIRQVNRGVTEILSELLSTLLLK